MVKIIREPQFTNLEAQLVKEQYTTTGTAPNFLVNIPNVNTFDDLVGKELKIINHVAIPFGANVTLNVNNLGAKNISNYKDQNTTFRVSTLDGQVWSLVYNGKVFTMADFGDTMPISGSSINQTVGGQKVFANQVSVGNATGFGIMSSNGAVYTKQTNATADVVGDIRIKAVNTTDGFIVQTCTVANATKGAGAWVTIEQGASINQLPFETMWTITPTAPINVGTRAVDLTPLFCNVANAKTSQGADLFTYDVANGVIKFNSPSGDYTSFSIILRMNGLVFASSEPSSQYRIFLTRKDGVPTDKLPSLDIAKTNGSDAKLTNTQLGPLLVRVIDKNDPFVTEGFRIWAIKDFGADLQFVAGKQQQLLLIR